MLTFMLSHRATRSRSEGGNLAESPRFRAASDPRGFGREILEGGEAAIRAFRRVVGYEGCEH